MLIGQTKDSRPVSGDVAYGGGGGAHVWHRVTSRRTTVDRTDRPERTIRNRRGSEDHLRIHRPLLPLQADHMKTDGMGSDNNPFVLIIQSRSYRLSALPHGSALPKKTNISKVISLLHRKKLAGQQFKEFKICMLRHFLCNKQSNNITSSGSVNGHYPLFRSRLFGISVSLFG